MRMNVHVHTYKANTFQKFIQETTAIDFSLYEINETELHILHCPIVKVAQQISRVAEQKSDTMVAAALTDMEYSNTEKFYINLVAK